SGFAKLPGNFRRNRLLRLSGAKATVIIGIHWISLLNLDSDTAAFSIVNHELPGRQAKISHDIGGLEQHFNTFTLFSCLAGDDMPLASPSEKQRQNSSCD